MKVSRIAAGLGLILPAAGCFFTLQAQESSSSAVDAKTAKNGNEE